MPTALHPIGSLAAALGVCLWLADARLSHGQPPGGTLLGSVTEPEFAPEVEPDEVISFTPPAGAADGVWTISGSVAEPEPDPKQPPPPEDSTLPEPRQAKLNLPDDGRPYSHAELVGLSFAQSILDEDPYWAACAAGKAVPERQSEPAAAKKATIDFDISRVAGESADPNALRITVRQELLEDSSNLHGERPASKSGGNEMHGTFRLTQLGLRQRFRKALDALGAIAGPDAQVAAYEVEVTDWGTSRRLGLAVNESTNQGESGVGTDETSSRRSLGHVTYSWRLPDGTEALEVEIDVAEARAAAPPPDLATGNAQHLHGVGAVNSSMRSDRPVEVLAVLPSIPVGDEDARKISTGTTVTQTELEKIPTARYEATLGGWVTMTLAPVSCAMPGAPGRPDGPRDRVADARRNDADPAGAVPKTTGKLQVKIPEKLKPGEPLSITYADATGKVLLSKKLDSVKVVPKRPLPADPRPTLTAMPKFSLAGRTVCGCGYFPDSKSRNGFELDGKAIETVSASSHMALLPLPASTPPGPHSYSGSLAAGYSEGDVVVTSVLTVAGRIDTAALKRGEGTEISLLVNGTKEPVPILLVNNSPRVININNQPRQTLLTSGGARNELKAWVQSVGSGDFAIDYSIEGDRCPCMSGR